MSSPPITIGTRRTVAATRSSSNVASARPFEARQGFGESASEPEDREIDDPLDARAGSGKGEGVAGILVGVDITGVAASP